MNSTVIPVLIAYFAVISLISCIITVADKRKAVKGRYRIPESTLMLFGFIGGALSEYLTMKIIRHKTRHKKFMIGLPLFILLHIGLIVFYITNLK